MGNPGNSQTSQTEKEKTLKLRDSPLVNHDSEEKASYGAVSLFANTSEKQNIMIVIFYHTNGSLRTLKYYLTYNLKLTGEHLGSTSIILRPFPQKPNTEMGLSRKGLWKILSNGVNTMTCTGDPQESSEF